MNLEQLLNSLPEIDTPLKLMGLTLLVGAFILGNMTGPLLAQLRSGEHKPILGKVLNIFFLLFLITIVLAFVLTINRDNNQYNIEITDKRLSAGIPQKTINDLYEYLYDTKITAQTTPEEKEALAEMLFKDVQTMQADLRRALTANDAIRNKAFVALNFLDQGEIEKFKRQYDELQRQGVFKPAQCIELNEPQCPEHPTDTERPISHSPGIQQPPAPQEPTVTPPSEQFTQEDLKKLRFMLATYGKWSVPDGNNANIHVYPSIAPESQLMMTTREDCASEIELLDYKDSEGLHYYSNVTKGGCFKRNVDDLKLEWPNKLGLNIGNFRSEYERQDLIPLDIFNEVIHSSISFEHSEIPELENSRLENLATAIVNQQSLEQEKLISQLYYVNGLSVTEIEDIKLPKNKKLSNVANKVEHARANYLNFDFRTASIERVTNNIQIARAGYANLSFEAKQSLNKLSPPAGINAPSPPTAISVKRLP